MRSDFHNWLDEDQSGRKQRKRDGGDRDFYCNYISCTLLSLCLLMSLSFILYSMQAKKESAGLLSDNRLLYREVVCVLGSLIQIVTLKKGTRYFSSWMTDSLNDTFSDVPEMNVELYNSLAKEE